MADQQINRLRQSSLTCALVATMLSGAGGIARGQDLPVAGRERRVVEEIIVTAQKQEQSIQDVPISMSALDGELLQQASVTDFRDLALYAPNVRIDNGGAYEDVRVRGFGSPLSNKAFEQSVGLVVDGVPYGRLPYWEGALFDIERVEILRGPQGTLFGKNTTAGIFNVITRKPSEEFTGSIALELGELDRRRAEATVGGPLVAGFLNFRLAGLVDERDGYVKNTTARVAPLANDRMIARDRKALRAQLGFPDLLGAHLVVGYERADLDSRGVGWEFSITQPEHAEFARSYDPGFDAIGGNFVGSLDQPESNRRTIDSFVANASYDIGGWGLDAVAGYSILRARDEEETDFTPAPMIWVIDVDKTPQTVFEIRTSSPAWEGLCGLDRLFGLGLGRSDFIAGFFYLQREIANPSPLFFALNVPMVAQLLAADETGVVGPCPACDSEQAIEDSSMFFEETTRSLAGFAHVNWDFTDRWTLEYGMRFTHEAKDAHWNRVFTRGAGAFFRAALNHEEFTADRSRSESELTPKVSLRYGLTDDVNLYASWGKGFKSGGFNQNASNDDVEDFLRYDPEKATSWELGAKMTLLDGEATVNVGLFRQEVTDLQVFTVQPGTLLFRVENAAKARSQGVEIDSTWLPASWLTLRGTLGFIDAKYLDFPINSCTFDRENTDGDDDPRCDVSGEPVEFTPRWTSTLMPVVRFPFRSIPGIGPLAAFAPEGTDFVFGLTVEYKDVHFADRTLDPRTRQPSYIRLGADFGFGNLGQGWSVRLVGQNLSDEVTVISRRDLSLVGRSFVQILDPPRLLFGELRWSF